MPKFTHAERTTVKSLVANLTIKRIPENEIINAIFDQTNKMITTRYLSSIKRQIKKESHHWYRTLREGEYEYIHEFKERINEIIDLQKKHHEIIIRNEHNPQIQQTSLAELHKLNITLSNYYDIAPYIISNGATVSNTQQTKAATTEGNFIV